MQYANNFNPVIQEAFFIFYSNTSLYFQLFFSGRTLRPIIYIWQVVSAQLKEDVVNWIVFLLVE